MMLMPHEMGIRASLSAYEEQKRPYQYLQNNEWVPMRKGVHFLFRYRDVSLSANSRYLDALSDVSDPIARVAEVDRITRR